MTKTNFTQFPESMHHLIRYVVKGETRRLYDVGRIGDGSKIKTEQIRRYPYEIVLIKVTPVRGYGGSYVDIDFRNKVTAELDQTSLPTSGEEIVKGLEEKLSIKGNAESRIKFWGVADRKLNNEYLEQFKGIEVIGVAVEHVEKNKKYNRLIGIFLD
ncbi:MAG: hypothetical protein AABX29_06960 [Nanoarchaeota archaeon]